MSSLSAKVYGQADLMQELFYPYFHLVAVSANLRHKYYCIDCMRIAYRDIARRRFSRPTTSFPSHSSTSNLSGLPQPTSWKTWRPPSVYGQNLTVLRCQRRYLVIAVVKDSNRPCPGWITLRDHRTVLSEFVVTHPSKISYGRTRALISV